MKRNKGLSRREFLRFTAAASAGLATGISLPGGLRVTAQASYAESPMLAEMDLPPVAERLPVNPLVVEPWEQIGTYGNTWNMVVRNVPHYQVYGPLQYEPLLRYSMGGSEILPNVAESWEVNDDSTEFTFVMREGIKWSDGIPLTSDDVVFWFEDIISNEALFPAFPSWMTAGGQRPTLEKIDDVTIRFVFPTPAPYFERIMGHPWREPYRPRHYLEQFHADYANPDELAEKVSAAGYNDWTQLFLAEENRDTSVGCPVVFAWDLESSTEEGNVYVRNPYYWKVDPEGNQLPYIDRVRTEVVRELAVAQLKALSGEAHLQTFSLGQFPRDTLVLKQGREQGNYRVIDAPISEANVFALSLNLTHKNPLLREVFNDRRFRQAMSVSINRDEIREIVYLGVPQDNRHNVALPGSPYYHEGAAHNYTQFDIDMANSLLDEMGLTDRNGDGMRLLSDGQPVSVAVEVRARRDDFVDALELIAARWRSVGINASVKPEDDSLFVTRLNGNEMDANADFAGPGLIPPIEPTRMIAITGDCLWAPEWGRWYATRGESGEEPPQTIQTQTALYDQLMTTPSEEERIALWGQIMDIQAEELFHIGICERAPVPVVVINTMHNVPETGWDIGWEAGHIGTTNPCQYYKLDA